MTPPSVFIPTQYATEGSRTIFLAGPIQGAEDWQAKAIDILLPKIQDIVITSPRRKVAPSEFNYEEQVNWESYHLNLAGSNGAILFWLAKEAVSLPGRSYAQTTRAELFEWKERHIHQKAKLVIGIEDGFTGDRYIRMRLSQDCPDIEIQNSLESVCNKVIESL